MRINITDLSLSEAEPEDQPSYLDVSEPQSKSNSYFQDSSDPQVYLSLNSSEKQRLLKNLTNTLLISENNQARLVFHGASNPQHARGFRIEYSFIPAQYGGVLIRGSSDIYVGRDFCQWIIEEPGQKHLNIILRSSYLQYVKINIYDNSTGAEGRLLNSYQSHAHLTDSINEYFDSSLVTVTAESASMLYIMTITYELANQGTLSTSRPQPISTDFICRVRHHFYSSIWNHQISELARKVCLILKLYLANQGAARQSH